MLFNTLIKVVLLSQVAGFLGISDLPQSLNTQDQATGVQTAIEKPLRLTNQSLGLDITAKSALAIDQQTGKVLFAKAADKVRPIASITKLVSALVFLESQPNWDKQMTILRKEEVEGGRLYLRSGEQVTVENLFYTSLVGSANNATLTLARSTGLSQKQFVAGMNKKVKDLGLVNSHFEEPTGLSEHNISTAAEVARLLNFALEYEIIKKALSMEVYEFKSISGFRHRIKNTNKLLDSYLDIQGGKTGFTDEAGNCLAVNVLGSRKQTVTVVVLGSAAGSLRFQEAKGIAQWVFDNWIW